MFIPTMLVTVLGDGLDLELLGSSWQLAAWAVLIVLVGMGVGTLLARVCGVPDHLRREFIVSCSFGNAVSLPLLLLETLVPQLKTCMYNFMACSTMMFGPRSLYCITYKSNQIGFNIYRRMYHHNFLVNLSDESYEDCRGMAVNSNGTYVVAKHKEISIRS